ncbi:hypothetical protein, partial [Limnohabitans sp.]|uniref:hypothetical protein n=1 Tax=Limnohabitans sp. TaxID=1907725 RepID=UPI0033406190
MTTPLFVLEEATIEQLQSALKAGRVNCVEVVQRYIDRCRRYNGVATRLVTAQGEVLAEQPPGTMRAGQPLSFPRQTVA